MSNLPAVVILGGVAYYAYSKDHPSVVAPGQPGQLTPGTPGSTIGQKLTFKVNSVIRGTASKIGNPANPVALDPVKQTTNQPGSGTTDPSIQAKLDMAARAVKAKFDESTAEARAAFAAKLNADLKIDPPLTGKEDWKQLTSVVAGAVGGILGGPLGALVGVYLGGKLTDWLTGILVNDARYVSETGDAALVRFVAGRWYGETTGGGYAAANSGGLSGQYGEGQWNSFASWNEAGAKLAELARKSAITVEQWNRALDVLERAAKRDGFHGLISSDYDAIATAIGVPGHLGNGQGFKTGDEGGAWISGLTAF